MDSNLGSTLAFKCIFCYDFISIFFIGTQYMIHDGKKKWIEKNYQMFYNQQITMDFWTSQSW
jgi:nitrate reductase gamma subunit